MHADLPKIAIVIPYFQRERGILRRAIVSVLGQDVVAQLHVLVIDDASPITAADELEGIADTDRITIEIIRQKNRGPAGARNRGLDSVPDPTDYVAFLDSDDEWFPHHLRSALAALERGYDFYFADFYQLDQNVTAFSRAGRMELAKHQLLDQEKQLYAYQGDFFEQILLGNVVGTPTVAFKRAALPAHRFNEQFVFAGEDYLFWMSVAKLTSRIAFSSASACRCGRGVNLYSGSGWGTETSLDRIVHETRYQRALGRLFKLSAPQQQAVNAKISRLRREFGRDVLHRVRHRRKLRWRLLLSQLRSDPLSALSIVTEVASIVRSRA